MITVDAKYYGNAMQVGRKCARLKRHDVAQMLGITHREYARMENGNILIPEKFIYKLMAYAFLAMITRHGLNKAKHLPH